MKTKLRAFVILICLVSQLVIGVGVAEGENPTVHIVSRGDTLYSVARRCTQLLFVEFRSRGAAGREPVPHCSALRHYSSGPRLGQQPFQHLADLYRPEADYPWRRFSFHCAAVIFCLSPHCWEVD